MKYDNVNNPKHYEVNIDGEKVNTLKMVQAVVRPIENGVVASAVKDVLKYTIRAEKKNGLEDYKKARFYLDEIIKELEKGYKMIDITKDIKMLKMYLDEIEEKVEALEQEEDTVKIYTITKQIGRKTEDLEQILEVIQNKLDWIDK